MKIIQRRFQLFLLLPLSVLCALPATGQTATYRLKTADSLFQAKRYTQSLAHYEEILNQREYTPAMLLKMAYIHEGLDQTGEAIYYLNLYHLITGDNAVQERINDLAFKHNLQGYSTSGSDRVRAFYQENHLLISALLAALALLMLSVIYHTRVKKHARPIASGLGLIICTAALGIHLFHNPPLRAIVAEPSTYLMAGPSAAADVIDVVGDGHRMEVLGKKDVWLEVRWDRRTAFVKESAVRTVNL